MYTRQGKQETGGIAQGDMIFNNNRASDCIIDKILWVSESHHNTSSAPTKIGYPLKNERVKWLAVYLLNERSKLVFQIIIIIMFLNIIFFDEKKFLSTAPLLGKIIRH